MLPTGTNVNLAQTAKVLTSFAALSPRTPTDLMLLQEPRFAFLSSKMEPSQPPSKTHSLVLHISALRKTTLTQPTPMEVLLVHPQLEHLPSLSLPPALQFQLSSLLENGSSFK